MDDPVLMDLAQARWAVHRDYVGDPPRPGRAYLVLTDGTVTVRLDPPPGTSGSDAAMQAWDLGHRLGKLWQSMR